MDKNQLAIQYMEQGKMEEAAKIFGEMIEENPKDPIGYINFGNVLASMNDTERAIKFFERAIELDPQAATAYYGLGGIYYDQDDLLKVWSQQIRCSCWGFVSCILISLDWRCHTSSAALS